MSEFAVFGVAGALVVKRVVDFLKRLGLPGKWAMLMAFVVAALLLSANEAAAMSSAFLLWYERAWRVLFFALVAAEVYDLRDDIRNGIMA